MILSLAAAPAVMRRLRARFRSSVRQAPGACAGMSIEVGKVSGPAAWGSGRLVGRFPRDRRPCFELREVVADFMPRGHGTHEDMRLRLRTRITIDRSQRYRGDPAIFAARESRAALAAKTPACTGRGRVNFYLIGTRDPVKIVRSKIRIGRKRRAMLAPAHRAMAVIRVEQRPRDSVSNPAAQASAFDRCAACHLNCPPLLRPATGRSR